MIIKLLDSCFFNEGIPYKLNLKLFQFYLAILSFMADFENTFFIFLIFFKFSYYC